MKYEKKDMNTMWANQQCAKFHFWVTPDFSDKSGVTFNQKIGIGIGSENREWKKSQPRF